MNPLPNHRNNNTSNADERRRGGRNPTSTSSSLLSSAATIPPARDNNIGTITTTGRKDGFSFVDESSTKEDPKRVDKDDLDTLRKEYRNMQANRNALAHESDRIQRRQLVTLEKLRAENETLKSDVARLQTRHMTRPINSYEQSQLDRLYQELEKYTCAVEEEKNKTVGMENEISKLSDEIWKCRRNNRGGVNATVDNQRQIEKKVQLLEGKLDQALSKFNKCVSKNKLLREEIDGLRTERVTFEKVHKKVEKDLSEKKKQMAYIIEQSNQAYEQRDRALLEIAAVERLNRKEEDAYQQQVAELNDELEAVNGQLLNATKRSQTALVLDPVEEEKKAAQRLLVAKANEIARAEEEYAQQLRQKLQIYEDAFREISIATGISDVDVLVKVFIENEERNFSLFRFSNDQVAEIERLEEAIHDLRAKEMMYKAAATIRDDRIEEILKLETELKSIEDQTVAYESKYNRYQQLIEDIIIEIKSVLTRLNLKFDDEEFDSAITTDNILHYLGIIEEKASEIVSRYHRTHGISDSVTHESTTIGAGDQGVAPLILVNPPQLLDCSSDESGDEGVESTLKPLHRSDIDYSKIESTLSKRKALIKKRGSTLFQPRRLSLY